MPPLELGVAPAARSAPSLAPAAPPPSLVAASGPRPGASGPPLSGAIDPDGSIWKEAAFRRDPWQRAADSGDLAAGPVILSKARWLAERAALRARRAPIGLYLESGAALEDIAGDLALFSLIALNFPKFSDGRAFSTASLLREKYGFTGELRAVGNVLSDQIPFMRRVGFDAFEVSHQPTRRQLREGRIAEVRLHYQPASGEAPAHGLRPWLRRRLP